MRTSNRPNCFGRLLSTSAAPLSTHNSQNTTRNNQTEPDRGARRLEQQRELSGSQAAALDPDNFEAGVREAGYSELEKSLVSFPSVSLCCLL